MLSGARAEWLKPGLGFAALLLLAQVFRRGEPVEERRIPKRVFRSPDLEKFKAERPRRRRDLEA